LRVRLALARLTVAAPGAEALRPFAELIADEVNVKEVVFSESTEGLAARTLSVVFQVAAPRLGPDTQSVAAAARQGDWEVLEDGRARVGSSTLEPGEFDLKVQPADGVTTRALPGGEVIVVLATAVTPELTVEGRARDLVRAVQQMRRDQGLDVADRILLEVGGPQEARDAVEAHRDWIAEQVLTREVRFVDGTPDRELADGTPVFVRVTKL